MDIKVGAAAHEAIDIVGLASTIGQTFPETPVRVEIESLTFGITPASPGGLDVRAREFLDASRDITVSLKDEVDFPGAIKDAQALATNLGRDSVMLDFNGVKLKVPTNATLDEMKEVYLTEVCVPTDRSELKPEEARSWSRQEAVATACAVSRLLGEPVAFEAFGHINKAYPHEPFKEVMERYLGLEDGDDSQE